MGANWCDALGSLASMGTSRPVTELKDGISPFGDHAGRHRHILGGDQWRFAFANGFGACVVRHSGSYGGELGLWELAILDQDGHLTYETPITDDVIGRLTETDVVDLLASIEGLPRE